MNEVEEKFSSNSSISAICDLFSYLLPPVQVRNAHGFYGVFVGVCEACAELAQPRGWLSYDGAE